MTLTIEQTVDRIKQEGIIAIIRGDFSMAELSEIGDALMAAPLRVIEVTLNTPGALEAIWELQRRYGDQALIGAGTVRTTAQLEAAVEAGAQFTVAPNFDPATVARAQACAVLHLPGIFTPTEAQTAFAAGCRLLKLFPSDSMGPAYLKALRAPLEDIDFVPTGGIDAGNIGDYARAGAAAVGVGSSLIPKSGWSQAEIINRARLLRSAWEQGQV